MPEQWQHAADRLAARSLAADDPTGWFDRLYASAVHGAVDLPWDRAEPQPLLTRWSDERHVRGAGRTAVVVGCGLGADARFVAGLGFATTAFDVAPTAIEVARSRDPDRTVDYRVADLLALPAECTHRFDLVVEIYTVQALPRSVRESATAAVARLVATGGTLLVIAGVDGETGPRGGPPWPLTESELTDFAQDGLAVVSREAVTVAEGTMDRRWVAEFSSAAM